MSSSLPAGGTTKTATTATTTGSLFALALRAWNLCVLLVVIAALVLVSPAAVLILLPFFFVPPDWASEQRSGVRERKQDCVEVDRAEAPGGLDDDASSAEEGNRVGYDAEQEHGTGSSSLDEEHSDDPCDDEQRRFYFVDTGSYCRTFYDLLAFWRSMERGDRRCKKCSNNKVN